MRLGFVIALFWPFLSQAVLVGEVDIQKVFADHQGRAEDSEGAQERV